MNGQSSRFRKQREQPWGNLALTTRDHRPAVAERSRRSA